MCRWHARPVAIRSLTSCGGEKMALPLPKAKSKVIRFNSTVAFDICCSLLYLFDFFLLFVFVKSNFLLLIANSFDGEVLGLARVSRLHIGAYLCIASNGVPPSVSKRIVLNVQCKEIRETHKAGNSLLLLLLICFFSRFKWLSLESPFLFSQQLLRSCGFLTNWKVQ